jgi:predicted amidohydrolase
MSTGTTTERGGGCEVAREGVRVACVQLAARGVEESEAALAEAVEAAGRAGGRADLIVLPEATYPGYVLHDEGDFLADSWWERGVGAFGEVARTAGAYLVVGLVRTTSGRVRNSAALLGPDGHLLGVGDKAFLWHFDSRWFAPGAPSDAFKLPLGQAGIFICADARMMEIPRRLAVKGTQLLIDPTALVLGPSGVNAQIEYLLEARAWENGSFLAVANKCGSEAGIAHYAGRSAIFGPDGLRLAEAPPDRPATITAVIDVDRAKGPPIPRRRGGYPQLARPINETRIAQVLSDPPPARPWRLAIMQERGDEARLLEELAADLILTRGKTPARDALGLVADGFWWGAKLYPSGQVIETGEALVGLLSGDRMGVPEEVRCLMLEGASVIVWDRANDDETPPSVVRTRADENRVFVVVMAVDGSWQVIAPSGAPVAEGPRNRVDAVLVDLHLALTWDKEMAPTSDVVHGRTPLMYSELV